MNYLITGGAWFIGSSLANHLAYNGHSVTVMDDFSMGKRENIESNRIRLIEADVRDLDTLETKLFLRMSSLTIYFYLRLLLVLLIQLNAL